MSTEPDVLDHLDPESECFFVTPIGDEGTPIRKQANIVGKHIVGKAAAKLGLTMTRADTLSEPGQISHQVIEHVVTAKAAVADLTGSNPNVYYELALRHGAQRPVALIAHKDHMPNLAFDVSAERVIPYDHQDLDVVEQVVEEIATQLGKAIAGPVISPVATALNFRRLEEGDVTQRALADLSHQVARLGRDVRRLDPQRRKPLDGDPDIGREFDFNVVNNSYENPVSVHALGIGDGKSLLTATRGDEEPERWVESANDMHDLIAAVSERLPPHEGDATPS